MVPLLPPLVPPAIAVAVSCAFMLPVVTPPNDHGLISSVLATLARGALNNRGNTAEQVLHAGGGRRLTL